MHHAANPEYLDRNYGGIFIVFDRLFGTFAVERDDLQCRYGLVTPLRSNNPIIIAFHEWAALARDLWRARSWRERLACLIGPPNWRQNGDLLALAHDQLTPPSLFLIEPATAPRVLKRAPQAFDPAGLVITRHDAISSDGRRIPYVRAPPAFECNQRNTIGQRDDSES